MENSSPWVREQDSNLRPPAYGAGELPTAPSRNVKVGISVRLAPTAGSVSILGVTIMGEELFHILLTDRVHSMQNKAE